MLKTRYQSASTYMYSNSQAALKALAAFVFEAKLAWDRLPTIKTLGLKKQ